MVDLIKQLNEIDEESPAFDGLMLKLEMAINSDFSVDIQDDEFEFGAARGE
jgi:hypothetical protein